MIGDGVRQGSVVDSGPGVDDHAGGLIDDDEILVLKHDIERNVFRLKTSDRYFRKLDLDLVGFPNFV